jgi:hypothetical protein
LEETIGFREHERKEFRSSGVAGIQKTGWRFLAHSATPVLLQLLNS